MGKNKRKSRAPKIRTGLAAGLALAALALPGGLQAAEDYDFRGGGAAHDTNPGTSDLVTVGDDGLAKAAFKDLTDAAGSWMAALDHIFTDGPTVPSLTGLPFNNNAAARAHVGSISISGYGYIINGYGSGGVKDSGTYINDDVVAAASFIGAFANNTNGVVEALADGPVSISNISLAANNGYGGSQSAAIAYGFVAGLASGSYDDSKDPVTTSTALAMSTVTIDGVRITADQVNDKSGTSTAVGQVAGVLSWTGYDEPSPTGKTYHAVAEGAVRLTNITMEASTKANDSTYDDRGTFSLGLAAGVMARAGRAWARDSVTVEASAKSQVLAVGEKALSVSVLTAYGVQGWQEAKAEGDVSVSVTAEANEDYEKKNGGLTALSYGAAYGVSSSGLINVGNRAQTQTISATGSNYAFALASGTVPFKALAANISAPVILKAQTTSKLDNAYEVDTKYGEMLGLIENVMGSYNPYMPLPVKEAEFLGMNMGLDGSTPIKDKLTFAFNGTMDNGENKLRIFGAETVNIGGQDDYKYYDWAGEGIYDLSEGDAYGVLSPVPTLHSYYNTELKLFTGSYFINQREFEKNIDSGNYGTVTSSDPGRTDVNIHNGATLHIAGMIQKDLTVDDGAHKHLFATDTSKGFQQGTDYTLNLNAGAGSTLMFSQLNEDDGAIKADGSAVAMFHVTNVTDEIDGGTAGNLSAKLAVGEIVNIQAMAPATTTGIATARNIKVLSASETALSLTGNESVVGQKLFYEYYYMTGAALGSSGSNSDKDLYLRITRNATSLAGLTQAGGASPNAVRLAESMAAYTVTDGNAYASDFDRWVTALANLELDEAGLFADQLNQAHGEAHASTNNLLLQYYKGLFAQFSPQAPGGTATGSQGLYPAYGQAPSSGYAGESSWTARAGLFGNWASLDRDGRHFGADADSRAGIFSLEKAFSDQFSLGLGLAVGQTDIDYDHYGTKSESDDLAAAIYAGYRPGGGDFFLKARLAYGQASVETRRRAPSGLARASYDVDYFQAALSAGYDFRFENNLSLTPSLSLAWLSADSDRVRERGGGAHDLWLKGGDSDSFEAIAKLELAKLIPTASGFVKLHGNLGLAHEFGDERTEMKSGFISAPSFAAWDTKSAEIGSTRFLVGAGLEAQLNDYLAIALDYSGSFQENYDSHAAQASFKFSW